MHYVRGMKNTSFTAVMALFQAHDRIAERFSARLGSFHGLSLTETVMLLHLAGEPLHRLTRTDLAKRLHVSASTVTRMAAPLEKLGLLTREADARDARLAYVVLSAAGLEKAGDARSTLVQLAGDVFDNQWSADTVRGLSEALARLTGGAPRLH